VTGKPKIEVTGVTGKSQTEMTGATILEPQVLTLPSQSDILRDIGERLGVGSKKNGGGGLPLLSRSENHAVRRFSLINFGVPL